MIARRAGSYTVTPNGLVNASYASDRIVPNTAAGLYSTTEDLLRWQNGSVRRQGDVEGLAAER